MGYRSYIKQRINPINDGRFYTQTFKFNKMKVTYILVLDIHNGARKELERIEGMIYPNVDALKLAVDKHTQVYNLSDFMDSCNDQEINLKNVWIGYAHVDKGV